MNLHPAETLLKRLVQHISSPSKPATFLVGSPVADPIPRVDGVLDLIAARLVAAGESGDLMRGPEGYQAAFSHLNGLVGKDACNEVIRDSVLSAYKGRNDFYECARVGQTHCCARLEDDLTGWELGPAAEALGKLVANYPVFGEYLLTTNFDCLLEIAIRRAGGTCLRTALHGDGNLSQTVGPGCNVVHLHGYWYGTDTLHTVPELSRYRTALVRSLKQLLRERLLIVVGYGGWNDTITTALGETLADDSINAEVLWAFFEDDPGLIKAKYSRVLELLAPGWGRGRALFYSGVDAAYIFPELHSRLLGVKAQEPREPLYVPPTIPQPRNLQPRKAASGTPIGSQRTLSIAVAAVVIVSLALLNLAISRWTNYSPAEQDMARLEAERRNFEHVTQWLGYGVGIVYALSAISLVVGVERRRNTSDQTRWLFWSAVLTTVGALTLIVRYLNFSAEWAQHTFVNSLPSIVRPTWLCGAYSLVGFLCILQYWGESNRQ